MALIRTVRGFTPAFGDNCFLAETAVIIGDVKLGDDCSVWYGAVIRGDLDPIRIGNCVNIQDGAVLHTTPGQAPIQIGDHVTIGHNAVVHGAIIEGRVLVGMGAVVLDGVEVAELSIIAAGAVVTAKTKIESGSVYAGNPARLIKSMDLSQAATMIEELALDYRRFAAWYGV